MTRFLIFQFGFCPLEIFPLLLVIPPWSLEFLGSEDCSCNTQDIVLLPTALLDASTPCSVIQREQTGLIIDIIAYLCSTTRMVMWYLKTVLSEVPGYIQDSGWIFWLHIGLSKSNSVVNRSLFLPVTAQYMDGHSMFAEHWTKEMRTINVV